MAWIIGWDLILEYAVASSTVAHGWSHYFQDFLAIFGVSLPHALTQRAVRLRPGHRAAGVDRDGAGPARHRHHRAGDDDPRQGHPRERVVQRGDRRPEGRRRAVRDRRRRVLHQPGQLDAVRAVRAHRRSASSGTRCSARPVRPASRSGCWPARRSCSSPTSASTRSRPTPRRRRIRAGTCRSASSPRSCCARCSTSRSRRC